MTPYITQESRARLCTPEGIPPTPGELTYAITVLVLQALGDNPGFGDFAMVLGALEAAKLELYRRRVVPYEERKMVENGDVY